MFFSLTGGASPPTISKTFGAASINIGASTSLSFTITNPNAGAQLTGVAFTDALPAGLVVATPNGLSGSCGGGTITATAGSGQITLTTATLAASASCTFQANVTGTSAGVKNNSATVTSTEGGAGNTTNASITVNTPVAPTISKTFGAASINIGASTSLSFTITNPNAGAQLTGVAFTDTLPAGLVVATPNGVSGSCGGGTITATAGSGQITLATATLAASASCTFQADVTGTSAGVKNNSTQVSSTEGGVGNTTNASITVNTPNPPSITKTFGAASIAFGTSTSLSFTITNPNAGAQLTGVAFTDTLPAGLVVATPNGLSGTCGGGTITATAGSSQITLATATLAASASCTFQANVTGTTAGVKNNSTQVSSTEGGTGNTTNASIMVNAPVAPTIAKTFGAASIFIGGSTSLSFTITNPNVGTQLTGVAFTDNLPAGLVIATPNGLSGSCGGGTITATAGGSQITLATATLAPSASCTFQADVTGTSAGVKNNSTQVSSTEGGTGNTTSASITVNTPNAPTISKTFGAASINVGFSTSLSFTITNSNAGAALTGVAFTDNLPAGLVVATPNGLSGTCGGGTITATAGSGQITLATATLAASASCTFQANVTGTTAGVKNNSTQVTSTEGGAGNTTSASITVNTPNAPTISKTFGAASINVGFSTSLSFTVTNPNAGATLTGVAFTDNLPAGLVVATPNGLSGTCGGGTITATAGSGSVTLAAATLAPSASCTFQANITGTAAGVKNNTTGAVAATESGAGGTASASITVNTPVAPTISKTFGAAAINVGSSTSLSFTITNPNAGTSLTGVAFTDTLPAGMVVATPNGLSGSCGGGTITANAGSGSVTLAAATLAASASCTFQANVTGTAAGVKNNTTGAVSATESGAGGTASASITVNQIATATTVVSSVNPSLLGQPVTLTATVAPAAATGTVTFNDGATALCTAVPLASGVATCATSFAASGTHPIKAVYSGNGTYATSTSAVLVQTVSDQSAKTVETIGKFLSARNNQILSNEPDINRQIDRLIEFGGGGGQGGPPGGSGFAGSVGSTPSSGTQGVTARLGEGPDASDLSRMRFGFRDRPLAASRDDNPFPAPTGLGANDRDTTPGGGGSVTTGPLRMMMGDTEGAMRFGFATSLRDVARFAAQADASKTEEAGLGLATGRASGGVARFNPLDIWIEGKYASFRDNRASNDLDGHFGLVSIGADYVLNRSLLVGTMVQFDSMRQRSASLATDVSGQGWMVGPYATLRLSEHVFWRIRGAWGQSSNEVSPFLTYTDKFDTERWLASSTLAGRWSYGPWVFKPSASVAYMQDVAKSYTDTFGIVIPDVKSRLGQAKAGPDIGYRYQLNRDVLIEPHAGVQVIWNFANDTTAAGFGQINGDPAGPAGVRGRAEVGLRASTSMGISLDLSGSYDGIGAKDYDAFTGKATLRVPLN